MKYTRASLVVACGLISKGFEAPRSPDVQGFDGVVTLLNEALVCAHRYVRFVRFYLEPGNWLRNIN